MSVVYERITIYYVKDIKDYAQILIDYDIEVDTDIIINNKDETKLIEDLKLNEKVSYMSFNFMIETTKKNKIKFSYMTREYTSESNPFDYYANILLYINLQYMLFAYNYTKKEIINYFKYLTMIFDKPIIEKINDIINKEHHFEVARKNIFKFNLLRRYYYHVGILK